MKTKTIIELLTLSSSLYYIARENQLIDRFNELSAKGKESINRMANEPILDDDGNEINFMDKIILKASQAKEELDTKIEELIVKFYKKINVAHLDEITALKDRLEKSEDKIALLEARINHFEAKK